MHHYSRAFVLVSLLGACGGQEMDPWGSGSSAKGETIQVGYGYLQIMAPKKTLTDVSGTNVVFCATDQGGYCVEYDRDTYHVASPYNPHTWVLVPRPGDEKELTDTLKFASSVYRPPSPPPYRLPVGSYYAVTNDTFTSFIINQGETTTLHAGRLEVLEEDGDTFAIEPAPQEMANSWAMHVWYSLPTGTPESEFHLNAYTFPCGRGIDVMPGKYTITFYADDGSQIKKRLVYLDPDK